MKGLRETLTELTAMKPREGTVEFYFVVCDPKEDEPQVQRVVETEEKLARLDSGQLARSLVQTHLRAAIQKWRGRSGRE